MNVELQNVTKSYGDEVVLREISLSFSKGQIVALLGRNGAGKTTLINSMMDFISIDSGTIQFDGQVMDENPEEIKNHIGLLSEDNPLINEFNGKTYLEWSARLYRLDHELAQQRYQSLTEVLFEDDEVLDKPISQYSTGMKKKLSLISCLIHKPSLLILDEPFSGLDPLAANQIVDLLKKYSSDRRTIFITSHDLTYVQQAATHIAVLDRQAIRFSGTKKAFTKEGRDRLDDALVELLQPEEQNLESVDWLES